MSGPERQVLLGRYSTAIADMKEAQGALIMNLKETFKNPMEALENLKGAYKAHGHQELLQRLEKHPGSIGKVKGTLMANLAPNPLNPGAHRQAKAALGQMVGLVGKVLSAERKVLTLEVALEPNMGKSRDIRGLEL